MKRTITISEETYQNIKEQLSEDEKIDISSMQDFVGKKFFIRTVTYHLVGKVESIVGNLLQLSTASWIPDSGRFSTAIATGELEEIEPVGIAFVNINSVTDIFPWRHDLPTEKK